MHKLCLLGFGVFRPSCHRAIASVSESQIFSRALAKKAIFMEAWPQCQKTQLCCLEVQRFRTAELHGHFKASPLHLLIPADASCLGCSIKKRDDSRPPGERWMPLPWEATTGVICWSKVAQRVWGNTVVCCEKTRMTSRSVVSPCHISHYASVSAPRKLTLTLKAVVCDQSIKYFHSVFRFDPFRTMVRQMRFCWETQGIQMLLALGTLAVNTMKWGRTQRESGFFTRGISWLKQWQRSQCSAVLFYKRSCSIIILCDLPH